MNKLIHLLDAINLLNQLMNGKKVAGVLYIDQNTGKPTFKPFNRKTKKRQKDIMVKKLPWGWVKESLKRIKVYGSFPKDLGTARAMALLDEHTQEAKNAMIDRELDTIEFC
jgi:hypothetical protein